VRQLQHDWPWSSPSGGHYKPWVGVSQRCRKQCYNDRPSSIQCWRQSLHESSKQKCTYLSRYSVGIFDNPYYREQMFTLGLRPDTAYGCAFHFLMYPQPQAGFVKWLHAVLSLRK
jgi:hypothetical protein